MSRIAIWGAVMAAASLWFGRGFLIEATALQLISFTTFVFGAGAAVAAGIVGGLILPRLSVGARDIIDALTGVANGDLTRSLAESAETRTQTRLTAAASAAIDAVRTTATEIRTAARDTVARAQDVSVESSTVASAATRTAEKIQDAARQSAELVIASRSARDEGTQLRDVAGRLSHFVRVHDTREERLHELSHTSAERLAAGRKALDELAEQIRRNEGEVEALASASEEIRSFVTLVRKMARQSKLLALNAAMEAARAGEQGSGFAVVASEVRRLATSSSEAADRTDELVSGVLAGVARVRGTGDQAVTAVLAVRDAVEDALVALRTLEGSVTRQSDSVRASDTSMATTAGDALVLALEHVATAAEALDTALQDGMTLVEAQQSRTHELSAAAAALTRQAGRVASAAGGWRLEKGPDALPITAAVAATSAASDPAPANNSPVPTPRLATATR